MIFLKILAVYMLIVNLFLFKESMKNAETRLISILTYYLPLVAALIYILVQ